MSNAISSCVTPSVIEACESNKLIDQDKPLVGAMRRTHLWTEGRTRRHVQAFINLNQVWFQLNYFSDAARNRRLEVPVTTCCSLGTRLTRLSFGRRALKVIHAASGGWQRAQGGASRAHVWGVIVTEVAVCGLANEQKGIDDRTHISTDTRRVVVVVVVVLCTQEVDDLRWGLFCPSSSVALLGLSTQVSVVCVTCACLR